MARPKKKRSDSIAQESDPSDIELLEVAWQNIRLSSDKHAKQMEMIKEARNFRAGNQWEDADLNRLRSVDKPAITYDKTGPVIETICGTEVQNRQRMVFLPRHGIDPDASGKGDLANDAYEWAMERCGGDYERSRMFRDVVETGIGFTDQRIDIDEDPDGMVVLERVDPLEVRWDVYARKENLEDANWFARERLMHVRDIRGAWPEKAGLLQLALTQGSALSGSPSLSGSAGLLDEESLRVVNYHPNLWKDGAQKIIGRRWGPEPLVPGFERVIEYTWREKMPYYRVPDIGALEARKRTSSVAPSPGSESEGGYAAPSMFGAEDPLAPSVGSSMEGEEEEETPLVTLTEEQWKKYLERMQMIAAMQGTTFAPPRAIKQQLWCYKRAYICRGVVLEKKLLPFREFTLKAVTYLWDDKYKVWYGLVRKMIDPQRGVNKFFSAGVHQVSVAPKGTLIYEEGTFGGKGAEQIQKLWAKPSAPIQVATGSISMGAKRYEIIPPPGFPEAMAHMAQFSIESMRDATGIDIGTLTQGSQSAAQMRQKQVMSLTILAPLFASYERYRRAEARLFLKFIKEYIAPQQRIIRIGGPYNSQFRKLLKSSLADEYDLVLDDAPRDPNQKAFVWELLQPVLPMLFREEMLPPDLIDYFPGPAVVAAKMKAAYERLIQAKQQQPAPAPEKNQDPRFIESEIAVNHAQAEFLLARAAALRAEARVGTAETVQDMVQQEREMKNSTSGFMSGLRPDPELLINYQMSKRGKKPKSPGPVSGAEQSIAA